MNKVLKAFAKIKSQPDVQLLNTLASAKNELERIKSRAIDLKRSKLIYKEQFEETQKAIKAAEFSMSDKEQTNLQEEVSKIYTLPIRDLKVVRTTSTTSYLPKIFITTGMIELAPFDASSLRSDNAEYFSKFVGRKLGRFLIQYDWSAKHGGYLITMMNLTQQFNNYQSATIDRGAPCLGNIQDMVMKMFQDKQFFKLTETLLDYLANVVYGTPYRPWQEWFDRNHAQCMNNIKNQIFADYPTRQNIVEQKTIESMIPKEELTILNRDTTKDPVYPLISFVGQSTHEDCHCAQCLELRKRWALFQKFESDHASDPLPVVETNGTPSITDLLLEQEHLAHIARNYATAGTQPQAQGQGLYTHYTINGLPEEGR